MKPVSSGFWPIVLLIGATASIGTTEIHAQGLGTSRSLGGYGASWNSSSAGMGAAGPMIPYTGHFSGFMPYRMGSAGRAFLYIDEYFRARFRADALPAVVHGERNVVDIWRHGARIWCADGLVGAVRIARVDGARKPDESADLKPGRFEHHAA